MTERSKVQDLRSQDLSHMHAVVAQAYFPHELRALSRSSAPGLVRTLDLGPMTLGRIQWGTDISLDCDYSQDAYQVNIVLEGEFHWEAGGRNWAAEPGEAAVFVPGKSSIITRWSAGTTVLGVKISRGLLHSHVPEYIDSVAPLEESSPAKLDLRTSEGQSWVTFIRSSAEQIITDPAVTALPVVRDSLVNSVAAPMASFLSSTPGSVPADPYMIRRVRDAVERDISRPWSVDDMAAVSGVGRRRLQQAFRDYLGISPTAWLLRIRLDHAHRLLATAQETRTVAEVAYACGFNHLGRFARDFHSRFDCLPSEVHA